MINIQHIYNNESFFFTEDERFMSNVIFIFVVQYFKPFALHLYVKYTTELALFE